MADNNVELVRSAYEAYERGDLAEVLALVDKDFEWTYLDPSFEDPEPQVCRGRDELALGMGRLERLGLHPQLQEVAGSGDKVMVIVHIAGVDATRARKADDCNFEVLTLRDERITAMRACRNREEASELAGIS